MKGFLAFAVGVVVIKLFLPEIYTGLEQLILKLLEIINSFLAGDLPTAFPS